MYIPCTCKHTSNNHKWAYGLHTNTFITCMYMWGLASKGTDASIFCKAIKFAHTTPTPVAQWYIYILQTSSHFSAATIIPSSSITEVHVHVVYKFPFTNVCTFTLSGEVSISAKVREEGVDGGKRGCTHTCTCFHICLSCTNSIIGQVILTWPSSLAMKIISGFKDAATLFI